LLTALPLIVVDDATTHRLMRGGFPVVWCLCCQVGTPMYMSMEMLEGGSYDQKTDMWSFAVLVWEIWAEERPDLLAATKRTATRGPILGQYLSAMQDGDRLPLNPNWPADIQQLLSQCWLASPNARPTFEHIVSVLMSASSRAPF